MADESGRCGLWVLCVSIGLLAACDAVGSPQSQDTEPEGTGADAVFAPVPGSGSLHLVRLVARGDRYAFDPPDVRVRQGDVIRFVQTGNQPEAIVFDSATAPPGGAQFLAQHNLFHGPLLIEPGVYFEVAFADAPPGEYPFFSVPHRQLGMQGRVVVESDED